LKAWYRENNIETVDATLNWWPDKIRIVSGCLSFRVRTITVAFPCK